MEQTLTELRKTASTMGIKDVFKKTRPALIDEIKYKREVPVQKPVEINVLELMPETVEGNEGVMDALKPFEQYGLRIEFRGDSWFMRCAGKEDSGHISMPILDIMRCAEKLIK